MTQFSSIGARSQLCSLVTLSEDCARLDGEHLPSNGEFNLTFGPIKKLRAQLGFQVPDLLTKRRLAQMQTLGGPAKVQSLGHGKEVTEVPKFHKTNLNGSARVNISQKSGLGTKNVFYEILRLR
jgi:hypothetical protein